MQKLKKEFDRFFKKLMKKYWQACNDAEKQRILIETLGMYNPVTGFEPGFLERPPSEQEIIDLKKNLDAESIKLIDLFIKRVYCVTKNSWIFNKECYFTPEELANQNESYSMNSKYGELKFNPEYDKFKTFNFFESVYKYHNGLTFLPKEVLEGLKNKDIIDGGAYIGDSAFIFLEHYEPSCIYAFEPSSKNYEYLIKNIKDKNCEDKIKPVKLGLGEKKEVVSASGDGAGFALSREGEIKESWSEENIEIATIDEFVNENNLNLGLIKLDVEGYELETIKGAINTIKEQKPVLLISVYHTAKDFFEIKPLLEELNLDYNFMLRKLINYHPVSDTMLICY